MEFALPNDIIYVDDTQPTALPDDDTQPIDKPLGEIDAYVNGEFNHGPSHQLVESGFCPVPRLHVIFMRSIHVWSYELGQLGLMVVQLLCLPGSSEGAAWAEGPEEAGNGGQEEEQRQGQR